MIKAVLFDLDGTLVNSLRDLADSLNAAFARFGLPPRPTDNFRLYAGGGTEVMIRRALGDGPAPVGVEEISRVYTEIYAEHCLDNTREYPGMSDALRALRSDGIKTAAVTNKSALTANKITGALFPGLLDTVQAYREPFPPKPDPTLANEAARELGVLADECLVVGDSEVDVRTAHNMGATALGALWGFRGQDELELAGVDFMAAAPSALPTLLKARNRVGRR